MVRPRDDNIGSRAAELPDSIVVDQGGKALGASGTAKHFQDGNRDGVAQDCERTEKEKEREKCTR